MWAILDGVEVRILHGDVRKDGRGCVGWRRGCTFLKQCDLRFVATFEGSVYGRGTYWGCKVEKLRLRTGKKGWVERRLRERSDADDVGSEKRRDEGMGMNGCVAKIVK